MRHPDPDPVHTKRTKQILHSSSNYFLSAYSVPDIILALEIQRAVEKLHPDPRLVGGERKISKHSNNILGIIIIRKKNKTG